MPRIVDLKVIRRRSLAEITDAERRYERIHKKLRGLEDRRWLACVTLTDMYASWEQFAERRLIAALNHNPQHFLEENDVRGVTTISSGLADYILRGGRRYFDFRSCSDLIEKADSLVSDAKNPFRVISASFRNHLDVAAALRNFIAHGSDASWDACKKQLKAHFNIKSAPQPGEFLDSVDRRLDSPNRGAKRILVFGTIFREVITNT